MTAGAGGVDRALAVAPREGEQPVDLAHLGPGQGVVQQPLGVGPHLGPVCTGGRDEPVEVAQ
ncbi:MAG: hypothetical protein WBF75_02755, partial [Pseudonocardiaceae bacterium]